jgi:SAM-dependent methyltransferase
MDNKEWEEKYKSKTSTDTADTADLLLENRHLLSSGKALDIAMGAGQNALFLASLGCDVIGVDYSASAVSLALEQAKKQGGRLTALKADILKYNIKEDCFDIILNFYFLERSLIPKIKKGLKKNGLVIFETYTADQARFGHPKNPDYLLKPNELLSFFLDFFIIYYHERIDETKAIASLIAQKV